MPLFRYMGRMTADPKDTALDDLFGTFPGSRITSNQADAIMATHWPKKELKKEASLFGKKWWDYRTVSPVSATYLFAHLFTAETRRIIRAHINDAPPRVTAAGKVIDWEPIKSGDIFEPPALASKRKGWERKIGSLIRARQKADDSGIPYPLFIKAGLKHYYFGRGTYLLHNKPILDIALLNNEDCFYQICLALYEEYESRILLPDHPRFKNPLREDNEAIEFYNWLLSQLDKRAYPERSGARIVAEGFISENRVVNYLHKRSADMELFDTVLEKTIQKIELAKVSHC